MGEILTGLIVAGGFALVLVLGSSLFERLTGAIADRLPYRWRWTRNLLTAAVTFGIFVVLRQLTLDRPQTTLVFISNLVAVALLVAGAVALGYALVQAYEAFVRLLR